VCVCVCVCVPSGFPIVSVNQAGELSKQSPLTDPFLVLNSFLRLLGLDVFS